MNTRTCMYAKTRVNGELNTKTGLPESVGCAVCPITNNWCQSTKNKESMERYRETAYQNHDVWKWKSSASLGFKKKSRTAKPCAQTPHCLCRRKWQTAGRASGEKPLSSETRDTNKKKKEKKKKNFPPMKLENAQMLQLPFFCKKNKFLV